MHGHAEEWSGAMRTRGMLAGGAIALVALAMPALGQSDDAEPAMMDPADRVLIHGYDPIAMQLLWTTFIDDGELSDECELLEGQDDYVYEIDRHGTVNVEGLDGTTCAFQATDVTGPEGQVNHGTVVSAFVRALEESGYDGPRGCVIRVIANSDYGKDEQQVKVGENVSSDGGETSVELTVSETTCGRSDHAGPPSDRGRPDDTGPPHDRGRPDHAGPPDETSDPEQDSRDDGPHGGGGPPPWAGPPAGKGGGNR